MGAFTAINLGGAADDGTGTDARAAGTILNANFDLAANVSETNNFTADQGFGTATPSHRVTIESVSDNIARIVAKGVGFGGSSIFEVYSERTTTSANPLISIGSAFSPDALLVETSGEMISLPTYNNVTGSAANVYIDTNGRLYYSSSSEKNKKDIKPVDPKYSANIYKIAKEAAIFYKSLGKHDNPDWTYYGLSAEKLALIDPRLVHYGYRPEDYEILTKETKHEVKKVIKSKIPLVKTKIITEIVTRQTEYKSLKKGAVMSPVGVQETKIIPLMLVEMDRQNDKINDLEKRLSVLEK